MIVWDTGPIVAMANEQDRHHTRCVELFDNAPGPLQVPAPILTEVCYLLERERGAQAEAGFLRSVRDDVFTLVALTAADLDRRAVARLCRQVRAHAGDQDALNTSSKCHSRNSRCGRCAGAWSSPMPGRQLGCHVRPGNRRAAG